MVAQLTKGLADNRTEAEETTLKLEALVGETAQLEEQERFLRLALRSSHQSRKILANNEVLSRASLEQEIEKNRNYQGNGGGGFCSFQFWENLAGIYKSWTGLGPKTLVRKILGA